MSRFIWFPPLYLPLANRVCEQKTCSFVIARVNPYFASQLFDNELTDGQSESCALCVFIEFLEAVEYLILVLLGDSATGITDGEECCVFRLFYQFQCDRALCRKFRSVDE